VVINADFAVIREVLIKYLAFNRY